MLMMGVYRKTPLLVTGFLVGAVVVYQVTYSLRDKTKDVVPAPKAPAVAPVAQPNQAGDANLRGAEEDGITIQFEKTEGYTTHGKKITVQKRVDFPVAGFSRHSHIGKLSLPLVIKKFSFEDKTLKGIPSGLNVINSSVYFKTGVNGPILVELYKYSPDGHNTSVHFFTKGANETWEEFFFGANLSLTKKLRDLVGEDTDDEETENKKKEAEGAAGKGGQAPAGGQPGAPGPVGPAGKNGDRGESGTQGAQQPASGSGTAGGTVQNVQNSGGGADQGKNQSDVEAKTVGAGGASSTGPAHSNEGAPSPSGSGAQAATGATLSAPQGGSGQPSLGTTSETPASTPTSTTNNANHSQS
ncbi:hypothetical protein BEWA_041530 [Theileria equi strain WA]|uniref:Signal peptide containing protein n=1 Tax=Theileria equi strain WA TaxID=1537102 RepID=L1LFS4_THEEQ|nr:hypothetical protein BEWA_041530 [Theileria equi strain WA]EKX74115.1 hypothetical protein BEWA_041530 [Theileria equi strain WA]|eukprot:XP_004833567.1 hypothetical protein BEWA_041530 [Theileria equi strain WA]